MATTRNLYKRKAGEFEQVRANKRLKLSWPTGIVRSIDTRLRTGISDIKSAYFFRQTVSLLHAAGVDTSWRVDRFLGSGGYGIVALWVQQDDDGNILDEIAIKDDRIVSRVVQDLDDPLSQEKDYSQEALLQSVVNSRNPDSMLLLRLLSASFFKESILILSQMSCICANLLIYCGTRSLMATLDMKSDWCHVFSDITLNTLPTAISMASSCDIRPSTSIYPSFFFGTSLTRWSMRSKLCNGRLTNVRGRLLSMITSYI